MEDDSSGRSEFDQLCSMRDTVNRQADDIREMREKIDQMIVKTSGIPED